MIIVEFFPTENTWKAIESADSSVKGVFDTEPQARYFAQYGKVLTPEEAQKALENVGEKQKFVAAFVKNVVAMYAMQKQLLIMADTFAKKEAVILDADVAPFGFSSLDFNLAMGTLVKVLSGVNDSESAALYKIVPLPSE